MSHFLLATGYLLLIFFTNYLPEKYAAIDERNYTVILSSKSKLTIHGSTNVSRFQYQYSQALQPERIAVAVQNTPQALYFSDAVIQLQANAFKCGQTQMDRDLQKLLLAEKYPYITIQLKKVAINLPHESLATNQNIQSEVEITLAGVTRKYFIPIALSSNADSYIFTGKLALDICEFGLEPPKVMMGLVTVKDNVDIQFDLQVCIEPSLKY